MNAWPICSWGEAGLSRPTGPTFLGEGVVLEWGLAKLVGQPVGEAQAPAVVLHEVGADTGHTVPGQALGTPPYMAPEQAAGRLDLIDQRTDVYGLGAILYEILTGAPPFAGDSIGEVLRKVREEEPAAPGRMWAEVPSALGLVCMRALAKQPADRPAAAADLALAVQGWQEFERRKAEEALRESESLYHSLVESLPCFVLCKDLEGRFTFANQRFCEMWGRPLDQLVGKTDLDFLPKELVEKYRRDDKHVLETGEALTAFRKASAIQEELADANPAVIEFQRDLARSYRALGVMSSGARNLQEQIAWYQTALAIDQKLADANPAVIEFQLAVAKDHGNIASRFLTMGKPEEALEAYRKTFAIIQKLADANPAVTESLLARNPTLNGFQNFFRSKALVLLAGLGNDAKAGVTKAEAAAFADQAVAALRNAIDAGGNEPSALKEPDFDPLRGREDFQKLVAELAKMAEPKE
jgi:PAS domain-containing protein